MTSMCIEPLEGPNVWNASDLVPLLYERFAWDRNDDEGESPFFELPICSSPARSTI